MRRREELRARVWLGHVLLDRVGEEGQARVSLVERPATANCDVSEVLNRSRPVIHGPIDDAN
jgi:hypothetical protein